MLYFYFMSLFKKGLNISTSQPLFAIFSSQLFGSYNILELSHWNVQKVTGIWLRHRWQVIKAKNKVANVGCCPKSCGESQSRSPSPLFFVWSWESRGNLPKRQHFCKSGCIDEIFYEMSPLTIMPQLITMNVTHISHSHLWQLCFLSDTKHAPFSYSGMPGIIVEGLVPFLAKYIKISSTLFYHWPSVGVSQDRDLLMEFHKIPTVIWCHPWQWPMKEQWRYFSILQTMKIVIIIRMQNKV